MVCRELVDLSALVLALANGQVPEAAAVGLRRAAAVRNEMDPAHQQTTV